MCESPGRRSFPAQEVARRVDGEHPGRRLVDCCDLRLGRDLDPWRSLDSIDQVVGRS